VKIRWLSRYSSKKNWRPDAPPSFSAIAQEGDVAAGAEPARQLGSPSGATAWSDHHLYRRIVAPGQQRAVMAWTIGSVSAWIALGG
jgi:hypothetical protein